MSFNFLCISQYSLSRVVVVTHVNCNNLKLHVVAVIHLLPTIVRNWTSVYVVDVCLIFCWRTTCWKQAEHLWMSKTLVVWRGMHESLKCSSGESTCHLFTGKQKKIIRFVSYKNNKLLCIGSAWVTTSIFLFFPLWERNSLSKHSLSLLADCVIPRSTLVLINFCQILRSLTECHRD